MKIFVKIISFSAVSLFLIFILMFLGVDFDDFFVGKKYDELNHKISKAEEEMQNMYLDIEKNNKEIEDNEKKIINAINSAGEREQLLNEYAEMSGFTDLRGPGITIKISDNLSDDIFSMHDKIVHNIDILAIVNDLNINGAEAISINGKRMVSGTEITCIGPVIRINGEAQGPPFIIKAIGNPSKLVNAINDENSYAYFIKTNFGINVSAMKNLDIFIGKNSSEIDYNFVELIEE